MKNKFVIMVASLLMSFVLITTLIWGLVFIRQLKEQGMIYAEEVMNTANENIEGYLKKLRLIAYILQNNMQTTSILRKYSYQNDKEQLEDMKNMQLILKSVMTGAEYMQNIYVYTENGTVFSAGGSGDELEKEEIEKYKILAGQKEIVFDFRPARDKYDYPELMLVKQLDIGQNNPASWVVIMINCRGIYGVYNEMGRYDAGLIIWNDAEEKEIYRNNVEGFERKKEIDSDTVQMLSQARSGSFLMLNGQSVMLMNMQSEITGWKSILLIPSNQIFDWPGKMLKLNAVILLLLSLAGIFLCRILAGKFLRNIALLTEAIELIQKDNLQLSVVIHSKDEAEVLYRSFADMIGRIERQIQDIKRHEKEKRVLTLKALQAQINPHFLYNSLNTIKWMAKLQGAFTVVEAVDALSSIMQLNMSRKTYITFQEEIAYLNKYICMREYQKATRIRFVCKIEEELKECYILKLLIQPIVENSLKHGEVMDNPDGYVSVSIYSEGEDVCIDVEDNGAGMDDEEGRKILENLKDSEGIGLFNIQKRLQLYYGEQYGVSITGEKGIFTRVSLKIPKRRQAGEDD